MFRTDYDLYNLEKVDFLKEVKNKYIKIDIYWITIVLLAITQGILFSMFPLSLLAMFSLLLMQFLIILSISENKRTISKFSFVYQIRFNEKIGKNIIEINKQIKQGKMKQKESNSNNKKEKENNLFEEEIKDDEVQVYKVSSNNNINSNVIDMELSHTYIKENNKTLKKVKERRY